MISVRPPRLPRAAMIPTLRRVAPLDLVPPAALALALVLWLVAMPAIDPDRMGGLGLLTVLPPTFYAAVVVLTVGFCVAVHRSPQHGVLLAAHVVLLILIVHGTPNIVYGTLRYSWAWKHVGMIEYIQRDGRVQQGLASDLSAYHGWPGFFALGAMLTKAAGLRSALGLAGWAPVYFNLLNLAALLLIFPSFTVDRRLAWLAAWAFFVTSWVGQDYFSPQAMCFFLYLVLLGILLRWFRPPVPAGLPPESGRLRSTLGDLRARWLRQAPPAEQLTPAALAALIVVIGVLMAAIASSHQLTPVMTIVALAALVAFGCCSLRSVPLLMLTLALVWISYPASGFVRGNIAAIAESFGRPGANADSTLLALGTASRDQQLIAVVGRALTGVVWIAGLLGAGRRLRGGRVDLTCLLLALAPFTLLLLNSYGGEILFRTFLFALPFMAFLGAALAYPAPERGRHPLLPAATATVSLLLLVGLGFAYYGKERMNYFTRTEVAAANRLYHLAPPGSLLVEGASVYPSRFPNYERFTYLPLARQLPATQRTVLRDPAGVLAGWMANPRYTASYLILTRGQRAYVDMTGVMPRHALERIQRAVAASPRFRVVLADRDAIVFTLRRRSR